MDKQFSFADSVYHQKRHQKFLARMEDLVPWQRLETIIQPNYPKPGNGRRPYPLMTMLRIHCLQLWYSLSDPALEEALKAQLDKHQPSVLPKSRHGKAFAYCLKYWDGLCEFLNDVCLELDNNLTEQEIKPFVIARKNFKFAYSVQGANALCLHFSLIRTSKHHKLAPYRCYAKILEVIALCQRVEDYEALLPSNIELEKVGTIEVAF